MLPQSLFRLPATLRQHILLALRFLPVRRQQVLNQGANSRSFEEGDHRQLHLKNFLEFVQHLQGNQGVTTQIKEIVVEAHMLNA